MPDIFARRVTQYSVVENLNLLETSLCIIYYREHIPQEILKRTLQYYPKMFPHYNMHVLKFLTL